MVTARRAYARRSTLVQGSVAQLGLLLVGTLAPDVPAAGNTACSGAGTEHLECPPLPDILA